ncbi:MAG: radical SAM protein [Nitrososphaerales archaeon]
MISWNITFRCNLKCAHCYVNAGGRMEKEELSTEDGRMLIDQISGVSKPILVLSDGEPLLREDIFELARYGTLAYTLPL